MTTTTVRIDLDIGASTISFAGSDVKRAIITEEIDPTSIVLPSNSLEFTLFSDDGSFNILNDTGLIASLEENQSIDVYETIDGTETYMGRFYLKTWDAKTPYLMDATAVDAIQLLDGITYNGGLFLDASLPGITNPINSEDLIDDILAGTGFDYNLDASLEGIEQKGYVPSGSSRVALQHALIAMGAYADCSRSDAINIVPFSLVADLPTDTILASSHTAKGKVVLLPPITSVETDYHNFTPTIALDTDGDGFADVNMKKIFTGSITSGNDYFFFIAPDIARAYSIHGTATVGSVVYTPTYYSFSCTGSGTFELWMEGFFKESVLPYVIEVSSTIGSKILIDKATLIDVDVVEDVAQRIYDFYQQKYKYAFKTFGRSEQVGDEIMAVAPGGTKVIVGTITKIDLDLTGGMVSDVEMIGDAENANNLASGKYDDAELAYIGNPGQGPYVGAYEDTYTELMGYGNTPRQRVLFSFRGNVLKVGIICPGDTTWLEVIIDENSHTLYTEFLDEFYEWDLSGEIGLGFHFVIVQCSDEFNYVGIDYVEVDSVPYTTVYITDESDNQIVDESGNSLTAEIIV